MAARGRKPLSTFMPRKKDGTRRYSAGSQAGRERRGPNHNPLNAGELARWEKLEADPRQSMARDRMHQAHLVTGLGLCAICWGWVDDPRHTSVGRPTRTL